MLEAPVAWAPTISDPTFLRELPACQLGSQSSVLE